MRCSLHNDALHNITKFYKSPQKSHAKNIEYMEPDDYLAWLGKRRDTEDMRAAWAAEKSGDD